MKEHLFRIGEVAKVFHIPVKTLRFYSEMGLLPPAYVDESSGYRYYSVEQFVRIDLIRNSRKMGMSLEEIRTMLSEEMTAENVRQLICRQIALMEQKIQEYTNICHSMTVIRDAIGDAQSQPHEQGYLAREPEQYYIAYPFPSFTPEEQELNFRKAALSSGEKREEVYAIFGTSTRYDIYAAEGRLENPDIRQFLTSARRSDASVQPAGVYACIIFDDNVHQKAKYYAILMAFLRDNGYEPCGDFIEEWIIPRLQDGSESTLIKLKIKIANPS